MKSKHTLILSLILASALFTGCGEAKEYSQSVFAMDTVMTVKAYGPNAQTAVEEGVAEIEKLEKLLSATDENSEIYALNNGDSPVLAKDTASLLSRALEIGSSTDGAYDMSIYPVVKLWGFPDKNYHVPTSEELMSVLELSGQKHLSFDEKACTLTFDKEGCAIDLGGIAKGYTSSRIMEIFKDNGVKSGIVVLGGNVQALGTKPDGGSFNIAIAHPVDPQKYIGAIKVKDAAVITSGGYERYFEENGVKYHHIIDPSTGYPSDSGLISVTIVSSDGTLADGLSTALFVMGKDKAVSYYQKHSDEFEMVLMDEAENIYVSQGLEGLFTSDFDYEILAK